MYLSIHHIGIIIVDILKDQTNHFIIRYNIYTYGQRNHTYT